MLLRSKFIHIKHKIPCFSFASEAKQVHKEQNDDIKKKISNAAFLKYELTQNPEFDKAFPHLAKYKPPLKIKRDTSEYDFIQSLTYHKRVAEEQSYEDTMTENKRRFVEGYQEKSGPIQWMSQEEKEKVHDAVEIKMQELEETGLSKEELLYDGKPGGVPLGLDPFFQLIKTNRTAREMLFKPGEAFTVEKVVELALRQDIGLDPALSRRQKNYLYKHQITDETLYGMTRNQITDREAFDPDAFFAQHHNELNMSKEILADPHRKYYNFPVTREQAKNANFRKIDPLDLHWRNTEFLCKFMGEAGMIKNRFQNRISRVQQKLVAKTIRHARHLMLLPYNGFLKPTDKKSLRTLQEDIEDFVKRKVNIETGEIYLANPGEEDLESENPYTVEDSVDFDPERFEGVRDLELEFMPTIPNREEIKLMEAQHYANLLKLEELKKQGVDVIKLQKLKNEIFGSGIFDHNERKKIKSESDSSSVSESEQEYVEQKGFAMEYYAESFEEFRNQVKNISTENIIEAYISERALNEKNLKKATVDPKTSSANKKSKEELLQEIDQIKRELGVAA